MRLLHCDDDAPDLRVVWIDDPAVPEAVRLAHARTGYPRCAVVLGSEGRPEAEVLEAVREFVDREIVEPLIRPVSLTGATGTELDALAEQLGLESRWADGPK